MEKLRIIFMGSSPFSVPSLQCLLENQYNIVSVITAPDKPSGRGQQVAQSPIKIYAQQKNIPVLQPSQLKAPNFIEELKSYQANLQVVVAFRMLPEVVWSMPALGTFNLHASLLPQYRGSAPINWAIINGEKETGVTTFFLQQSIDTGEIIFQEKEIIHSHDNAGTLYDRLMIRGSNLVLKTVRAIEAKNYSTTTQVETDHLHMAPKIFKNTCQINWNQSSEDLLNFVRGLCPHPSAWTKILEKMYKIFRLEIYTKLITPTPYSSWATDNKTYLCFQSNNGWVSIEELQCEGKRRMTITEFFRGNKIE